MITNCSIGLLSVRLFHNRTSLAYELRCTPHHEGKRACNAIARHIERSTQPDNAHPELRHLHMDEQTPHLHVTVVPIVTTEIKKKAKESNARKHYRTKPKNGPRLSADDIMTRENLTRFQDTYAEAMEQFGLERGIRGSEARHVDQHEYYRQ